MKTIQQMVREFHDTYRCEQSSSLEMSVSLRELRLRLIFEEVEELNEASGFRLGIGPKQDNPDDYELLPRHIEGSIQNPVEMADALGDIVYVCYGMAIAMGIDLDAIVGVIHESNMSKLGADNRPIINGYDADGSIINLQRQDLPRGKVIKGPNYFPPTDKIAALILASKFDV